MAIAKDNIISTIFSDVQKNEVAILSIIFLHSFLNGFALIFFETTASTLFLMEYSSSEIPYVYILSAIASVFFGFLFTRLEEKLNVKKLLKFTLGFILVSMLLFFVVIKLNDNKLGYFGIMVFKDILWMFAGIEFGIITSIVFDIRQGKRLFGILVSGEIIAGIIGGMLVGVILQYIETVDLLLISSVSMVLSFLVLVRILNNYSDMFNGVAEEDEEEVSSSYKHLFKNSYYVAFFVVSVLAFLVFYFIDYIFYYTVEQQFKTEKELATFFGIFFSVLNGVNLISSLFVSGKVLKNYGIGFGILAIPVVAILGTSSILVSVFTVVSLTFILVVALKILDEVLDISILAPTFKILYQAIPSNQRTKVLAFRETVIEPIAMGFAGAFLLLLTFFEGVNVVYFILITLSALWLYYGYLLKNGYVESLKKIINNRSEIPEDIGDYIDDNYFLEKIKSDNFVEVIYSLEYFTNKSNENLENILLTTLNHKDYRIRLKTLEVIGNRELFSFSDYLEFLMNSELNREVLGEGIITYCKINGGNAIDFVENYLHNDNELIREKTIIGLIKYCGIDGVMLAGSYLESVFKSGNEENILEAFKMLNEIGTPGFFKQIGNALDSENKKIKIAALKSIGNLNIKQFVESLIGYLNNPVFKSHAAKALKKFGFSIFALLKDEYETSVDPTYRESIVSIIASMKENEAEGFILEILERDDVVFNTIIKELYKNSFKSSDKELIKKLLDINTNEYNNYYRHKLALSKDTFASSVSIIESELTARVDNLFYILSYSYQKETLKKAFFNYKSGIDEKKVYAIELVDNLLSSDIKQKVIPILESNFTDSKENKKTLEYSLNEFLTKSKYPIILLVSVIYEIALNQQKEQLEEIKKFTTAKDLFLNETANWAVAKLEEK